MSFKMIGGTEYDGHEYTITDNKGMISPNALGLNNFYGGRVKQLGLCNKTKKENLYMCIENGKVIDLIKFDAEPEVEEVVPEPTYSDDVPLNVKSVRQPSVKASSLPRKGR